jgi:hypothetical protein
LDPADPAARHGTVRDFPADVADEAIVFRSSIVAERATLPGQRDKSTAE